MDNQIKYVQLMDLNEAIWRNHYQLVTFDGEDHQYAKPKFFGSAFILVYKKHHWLITADHVIHPDKHGMDKQKNKGQDNEYRYALINNKNVPNELQTVCTSLFGFYFYDKYLDLHSQFTAEELKELGATEDDFFERVDVAFCDVSSGFPYECLTHELRDNDGNLIVKHGLHKLMIIEESITQPRESLSYRVYGVVKNDIDDGIRFNRCNATYSGLKYIGGEDGLYMFQMPNKTAKLDEWAAISGSAMFDEEGKVVGVVVRVCEETGIVRVVPMRLILRLIDYALKHENDIYEVNRDIISQLKKLDLSTYPIEQVKALVNQFQPKMLNITISGPLFIERLRPGSGYTKREEVTYKTGSINDHFNRATIPGQTVFYGTVCHEDEPEQNRRFIALCESSRLAKTNPPESGREEFTLSKWCLKRDIHLGVIVNDKIFEGKSNVLLNDAKNAYKHHFTFVDAPLGLTEYCDFVTEEFSKPVSQDYEYMISAIIAERMMNASGLDGIIYPSVRTKGVGGMNVALKKSCVDEALVLEQVAVMEYVQNEDDGHSKIISHATSTVTDGAGMKEWKW